MHLKTLRHRLDLVLVLIVAPFLCLTALRLTPSHYHFILQRFGVGGHGPRLGRARPVRCDEFFMYTPLMQVAVNNHFQRFNHTSPYEEDLRSPLPLPLLDWALPFKPGFWLFFVEPALGYAFFHQFHACLLVLGYYLLFRRFAAPSYLALGGSLIIFFSSYVQMWWINLGLPLGYLPWLALALLLDRPRWLRAVCFLYVCLVMLFSTVFYPVLWQTMMALALLLVVAHGWARLDWKMLGLAGGAYLLAAGALFLYLHDPLQAMLKAPSMGGRVNTGGYLPSLVLLGLVYPGVIQEQSEFLVGLGNICESSSVGSYLLLLCLCFLDYRQLGQVLRSAEPEACRLRRVLLLVGGLFLAVTLWQVVRCPWWLGAPLAWHKTYPQRLTCFNGICLTVMLVSVLTLVGVRISPGRAAVFTLGIVGMVVGVKVVYLQHTLEANLVDLIVVAPVCLVALAQLLPWGRWLVGGHKPAVIAAAVLANIALFGLFNPIQSARPIFHRRDSALLQRYRRQADLHPDKLFLSGQGVEQAVLNGYGFRTPYATFLTPPYGRSLEILRRYLSVERGVPFELINAISMITPVGYSYADPGMVRETARRWATVLETPLSWFLPAVHIGFTQKLPAQSRPDRGVIDRITLDRDKGEITVEGWALTSAYQERCFSVFLPRPVSCKASFFSIPREDVSNLYGLEYALSGFVLRLRSQKGELSEEDARALQLIAHEGTLGAAVLIKSWAVVRIQ